MSEEEFIELSEGYMGICLECEEYQEGCEPDAENFKCESCGAHKVMGLENALIAGQIDIGE